jgi:tRNA threonylcarbamoyl adenosine modification protein (Sua5/YciO/YrdC/YwlC family)
MAIEVLEVDLYNPDHEQISHAVNRIKKGAVIVYPTDTIYGLAADIFNKNAIERIFKIKKSSKRKRLSFVCNDLKEASKWVNISNQAFRTIKRVLPGQYTFIFPASKDVPKNILLGRTNIGIRIPDSEIARQLVAGLGRPLLNTSVPKGSDDYFTDPQEIIDNFSNEIDIILHAGIMPNTPSTVIDFSITPAEIVREGAGDLKFLF